MCSPASANSSGVRAADGGGRACRIVAPDHSSSPQKYIDEHTTIQSGVRQPPSPPWTRPRVGAATSTRCPARVASRAATRWTRSQRPRSQVRDRRGNADATTNTRPANAAPPAGGETSESKPEDDTQNAPAAPKVPFYKKKWFWLTQLVIVPLGIALLFILLFPIVRAIVQSVVTKTTLGIDEATILNPANDTYVLRTSPSTHTHSPQLHAANEGTGAHHTSPPLPSLTLPRSTTPAYSAPGSSSKSPSRSPGCRTTARAFPSAPSPSTRSTRRTSARRSTRRRRSRSPTRTASAPSRST